MKKIALSLLTLALFVACSGGMDQKLNGNTYIAKIKVEVKDTTNQMEMMMAQLAEQYKFNMAFENEGVLKMATVNDAPDDASTGIASPEEELMTWKIQGDSLIITDKANSPQSFFIVETETGMELQNTEITFLLTPLAK